MRREGRNEAAARLADRRLLLLLLLLLLLRCRSGRRRRRAHRTSWRGIAAAHRTRRLIGLERRSGLQLILGHREAKLEVVLVLAGDQLERRWVDRYVLRADPEEA